MRQYWEQYLKSDVLYLAVIYTNHALEIEKIPEIGFKECLTDTKMGWERFGPYNKDRETCTSEDK